MTKFLKVLYVLVLGKNSEIDAQTPENNAFSTNMHAFSCTKRAFHASNICHFHVLNMPLSRC